MTKRPNLKDFFLEGTTIQKVHACYIIVPELYNYIQALDNYIDGLEKNVIETEAQGLTPLYKCLNLVGTWNDLEDKRLTYCISIRLRSCIKESEKLFYKYPMYYETVTDQDLLTLPNFGKNLLREFNELKEHFKPNLNIVQS